MGMLKGKTAIKIFKSFPTIKKKPYWGNHFWSRGYCAISIGLDEAKIRKYVKYQEERERPIGIWPLLEASSLKPTRYAGRLFILY